MAQDGQKKEKLTAIFTSLMADDLKGRIDKILVDCFDTGRATQTSFPFPPRDFDNAQEEVRELWAVAREGVHDMVSLEAGSVETGFSDIDIPGAVDELWRGAVERFEQRYTPSVAPVAGNPPHLTIIPGGRGS